eukprot:257896_1
MFWFILSLISAVNGLNKACTAKAGVPLVGCAAQDKAILGAPGQCISPKESKDECAYKWSCGGKGLTITIYEPEDDDCEGTPFSSASIAAYADGAKPECFEMKSCKVPSAIGSITESELAKCCSLADHHLEELEHEFKEKVVNRLHKFFGKNVFKHHG